MGAYDTGYKDKFRALTLALGHPPDAREGWELGEWLRGKYVEEKDTRTREEARALEPLNKSAEVPMAESSGQGDLINPGPAERAREEVSSLRGPGGGVMAVCAVCGRGWEREARRGRPNYKCGECR